MRKRKPRTNGDSLTALLLALTLLCGLTPRPALAVSSPEEKRGEAEHRSSPALHAFELKKSPAPASSPVKKSFGHLPASFEANAGQADARIKFLSRGSRHTLLLSAEGALLALHQEGGERREGASGRAARRRGLGESTHGGRGPAPSLQLLRMKFSGANPRPEIVGEGELRGKVNYFVGNNPSKWRAGVPTFGSVRYRNLYRGVDLVYHDGGGGRL
ncbi:MAG TPA: hypothetical protein VFS10_07985, partial [Pyrinomonadaceae bacterium]|nr:hypothetical protein [Pyrinomonadaceae bacterium]